MSSCIPFSLSSGINGARRSSRNTRVTSLVFGGFLREFSPNTMCCSFRICKFQIFLLFKKTTFSARSRMFINHSNTKGSLINSFCTKNSTISSGVLLFNSRSSSIEYASRIVLYSITRVSSLLQ